MKRSAADCDCSDVLAEEERPAGLMSMFKSRDVNPHEYDAKMKFWTRAIEESCRQHNKAVLTQKEMAVRFRRGDRNPAGLPTVIRHMTNNGQLTTMSQFLRGSEGWFSWGLSALTSPLSWALGYSNGQNLANEKLVFVDLVQEQADKVMDCYHSADEEDPLSEEVVEFGILKRRVREICPDDASLELVLHHLQTRGLLCVDVTPSGDKIVKFRELKESGPVKVTQTDANIHSLRKATKKLETDIYRLEDTAKKLEEECRHELRSKNKTRAKQLLRQKQVIVKKLQEKDNQYGRLLSLTHNLSQTKEQKQIVDAYRAGVSAFRDNLSRHGLSPEKIDETMDDIHEVLSDHEDISSALSQGPSGMMMGGQAGTPDDVELEQELEELLREQNEPIKSKKTVTADLPRIPTHEPEEEEEHEAAAEPLQKRDRLAELRRQLEAA